MSKTKKRITFRIEEKNFVAFKKIQVYLSNQLGKKTNNETFVYLLEQTKEYLENHHIFSPIENDEFILKFSKKGNKGAKIDNPIIFQILITEQEKQLFYNIAFSFANYNIIEELSYPAVFEQIIKLNSYNK